MKKGKLFKWIFIGIAQAVSAAVSYYFMKKGKSSSWNKTKNRLKEHFFESISKGVKILGESVK